MRCLSLLSINPLDVFKVFYLTFLKKKHMNLLHNLPFVLRYIYIMYTVTNRERDYMKVRDFMITKVFTVKPSNTIKELIEVLTSNRIGGVPVVDDRGHLVGMVSDGNVLRYLSPKPIGFAGLVYILEDVEYDEVLQEKLNTPVKQIMTKRSIISVSPDEDFERTLQLLARHRYKKLPVVNGVGRVIGVLSRGDLIYNLQKKILL